MKFAARSFAVLVTFLVLVIAASILVVLSVHSVPSSGGAATSTVSILSTDALDASSTVAKFGRAEQSTELNAPDAAAQIKKNYGPYVTSALLSQWENDPQSAPGRVVSSPWPDHIAVQSVTQTTNGYEVHGTLYLLSSTNLTQGGYAFADPVIIDLVKQGGKWLIESYQDLSAG